MKFSRALALTRGAAAPASRFSPSIPLAARLPASHRAGGTPPSLPRYNARPMLRPVTYAVVAVACAVAFACSTSRSGGAAPYDASACPHPQTCVVCPPQECCSPTAGNYCQLGPDSGGGCKNYPSPCCSCECAPIPGGCSCAEDAG